MFYNISCLQVFAVEFAFTAYPCNSGSNLRIEEDGFVHVNDICGINRPDSFTTFSNSLQVIFSATQTNTKQNAFYIKFKVGKKLTY